VAIKNLQAHDVKIRSQKLAISVLFYDQDGVHLFATSSDRTDPG